MDRGSLCLRAPQQCGETPVGFTKTWGEPNRRFAEFAFHLQYKVRR
jgi:hypothetical protein